LKTEKKLRAVIYTRVSTDRQAEKGTSLEEQLSACTKYALELGWMVVAHVQDAGVSGARYETRDGIQEVLALIEGQHADAVVIACMDRYSRDREHQTAIRRRIHNAGGRVELVNLRVDDTPTGNLLFSIAGDFAQYERETIIERCTKGRRRKATEGHQSARSWSPYGYHIIGKRDVLIGTHAAADEGRYVIVEDQAKWVREIFARYAAGTGLHALATWLSSAGVPTSRSGKMWRASGIKRMLENPVYKGKGTFGRYLRIYDESRLARGFKAISTLRERPEDEWITIEPSLPIVNETSHSLSC